MRLVRWLCGVALLACLGAVPAQAERTLLGSDHLHVQKAPTDPVEDPCGIAVLGGYVYVSDYYHHSIDVFLRAGGAYFSQTPFDPLDGPCALAVSAGGDLYANDFHRGVSRVLPSPLTFDEGESTGVAVDEGGRVYAADRTYVAVYEPSGQAAMQGGVPLRIGQGSLLDGYGVAVFEGRVYVPDAGDDTVKVFEPAVDPDAPSAVIAGPPGGFHSLLDAAVAIDPTNGHLLVVDNLQPGFEHPEAAIDEFGPEGAFLGQLSKRFIDGEPSGLAFGEEEVLYVTSGNSEESLVLEFGPYLAGGGSGQVVGGEAGQAPASLSPAPEAARAEASRKAPSPAAPRLHARRHGLSKRSKNHRPRVSTAFAVGKEGRHGAR